MHSLKLLGGVALEGPEGPIHGRAVHRRRLALLALLGVSRRPVARERLIGCLWPEHTSDAGRHLLSESLYVLRKELGDDVVLPAGGDGVALNPLLVTCDVAEFEHALDASDMERAALLYRGPFMDGFVIADAPEFERWIHEQRDHLAWAYANALQTLAELAEAKGAPLKAVEWWRRLSTHDPFSPRVAFRLLNALDAAGEHAAALRFAAAHAELLREELGVTPERDFAELEARIRARRLATGVLREVGDDVLSVVVDPGSAPPDEIASVLAELSLLYRKLGGSGITFSLRDAHVIEPEPW